MIIRKFVHACLLIEEQDKTVLIDPGNYLVQEKVLNIGDIEALDYLLITHEHADHMDVSFTKEATEKFPEMQIISNDSVASILGHEGLRISTVGNEFIELEDVPHEKLLGGAAPQNTLFRLFGKLTHPGDSHSFSLTTEVLALPVQAPWGSMVRAVELAKELKPKIVIPIHDWHWSEKARVNLYKMAKTYLQEENIEFVEPATGQELEV